MPNKKIKKIGIYIAIFCAGTITGHFVSGLATDSNKVSLNKAKDIIPPTINSPSNKSFSSTSKNELQYKLELRDQKVAVLKKELDQMIKKALLQEEYMSFLSSILGDNFDKTIKGDINRPIDELISQKLEAMKIDDQGMLLLIQSFINIDSDDVPLQMPIKDFAVKLIRIAANGVLSPLQSEPIKNDALPLPIYFDTSTNTDYSVSEDREAFSPEETKIFAAFDSSQLTDDNVLVKWYRADQPKIFLMESLPISPLSNNNHIWLDQPKGWSRGDYIVEIYSLQDNLNLIASGKYDVK
jgi:hypothetical protein